jgi:hypothetical protein
LTYLLPTISAHPNVFIAFSISGTIRKIDSWPMEKNSFPFPDVVTAMQQRRADDEGEVWEEPGDADSQWGFELREASGAKFPFGGTKPTARVFS